MLPFSGRYYVGECPGVSVVRVWLLWLERGAWCLVIVVEVEAQSGARFSVEAGDLFFCTVS
jgi:hypothetical protein